MSDQKPPKLEDVQAYQDFSSKTPKQWKHVEKSVDKLEQSLKDLLPPPKKEKP